MIVTDLLQSYVYLPSNKKCAKNTTASHADGFAAFFQFFKEEKGRPHYRIGYPDITGAGYGCASGREMEALSAYNAVSGV